jgi:hypothetical protein
MQIYYAILKKGEHIMPIELEADVSGIETESKDESKSDNDD